MLQSATDVVVGSARAQTTPAASLDFFGSLKKQKVPDRPTLHNSAAIRHTTAHATHGTHNDRQTKPRVCVRACVCPAAQVQEKRKREDDEDDEQQSEENDENTEEKKNGKNNKKNKKKNNKRAKKDKQVAKEAPEEETKEEEEEEEQPEEEKGDYEDERNQVALFGKSEIRSEGGTKKKKKAAPISSEQQKERERVAAAFHFFILHSPLFYFAKRGWAVVSCVCRVVCVVVQVNNLRHAHKIRVKGGDVPAPITAFAELEASMRAYLLRNIEAAGYTTPTPIQMQSIPILLHGRELMAIAPTGTHTTPRRVCRVVSCCVLYVSCVSCRVVLCASCV